MGFKEKTFNGLKAISLIESSWLSTVSQGSTLGLLLHLIKVNDLQRASKTLDQNAFADNTNLFYSHQDINNLSLL